MKAITKAQVIDLMDRIQRDGVDNTRYSVDFFATPIVPEKWYGCYESGCEKLQPGAYCALWTSDTECSDMPTVGKWMDKNLSEENIDVLDNGEGWVIIICLDLLGQ